MAVMSYGEPRFQWAQSKNRYTAGKDLSLNGIEVGGITYDGVSSRDIQDRYVIGTRLPGLRPKVDRFPDEQSAMAALERFTAAWFARVLPRNDDARTPPTSQGE